MNALTLTTVAVTLLAIATITGWTNGGNGAGRISTSLPQF
jgi:hypothetical protein